MTHLALALERPRDSVESIGERLKALVESSLWEYVCPIAYAGEITGGILDNFVVSFKTPPDRPHSA